MANDGSTQVPPNSTGNKIDCSSLSVAGATVYRQRVVIGDNAKSANLALVSAGSLQVLVQNAAVPVSGQVSVTGSVAISNTVTVTGQVSVTGQVAISNNINISAMPAVVNAAGTAHIGEVNISVMPAVVIAAGTNNIGSINNISATVLVAGSLTIGGTTGGTSSTAGSSFTLIGGNDGAIARVALMDAAGHQIISGTVALAAGTQHVGEVNISTMPAVNISAMPNVVIAAGTNNIGTINGISATVNVAGNLSIGSIATGTNNIGTVGISSGTLALSGKLDGISATVNVAVTNNLTIDRISATAVVVASGFYDSSSGSTTTIRVGDSANSAIRVNVVAGGGTGGSSLVSITGTATVVLGAGTQHIGEVNISLMPAVAVSLGALAAGTNNIGTVGISSGTLALSGKLDGISATVNVAVTNHVIIDFISATVNVSGSLTIGGTAGGTSSTAGSSFTLIGGNDGSLAHPIKTDANGSVVVNNISATVQIAGTVFVNGCSLIAGTVVGLAAGSNEIGYIKKVSATVVAVTSGFYDSSSGSTTTIQVGDSANSAIRCNIVAGISSTAVCVLSGAYDSSSGSTTTIAFGDSANSAIRVNVVAGGAGGGAVFGEVANAASLSTTNKPVLIGGNDSAGGAGGNMRTLLLDTSGRIILGAGANNIGTINNISAVVSVNIAAQSAGNILAIQGPVGFNASITSGNSPVLMGGRVKTSASTTATAHAAVFMWMDKAGRQITLNNAAPLHPSATHGPKSVTLSASANTVLVASAGTACIFVDSLLVTSNLAGVTRCDIYETASSAAPEVTAYLAIGGGGFTQRFDPPWVLSAGQALSARLKPSASAQVVVMVHFHVGPN